MKTVETFTETITCTINGIERKVPKGQTILTVCRELGIEIPTLCEMKELLPDGSCRMCVVEVEGARKGGLVTACSTICQENMVIHTHSPKVKESRQFILDLLLSNHVFSCFQCGQNGNCKLQDYSLEFGIQQTSFPDGKCQQVYHEDASNPFFEFNSQLCIMCRRCTNVCEKLQGRDVISIEGRGFDTKMSTFYNQPWSETICESCGNCVSHCPTGALSSKDNQKNYRSFEVEKVRTTCPHCGTGCQMDLLVKNGKIVGAEPADGEANSNLLCVKGKFGSYRFVHSTDRLTHPLIKKNGVFEEASWEEALSYMAERFKKIKKTEGADKIAGFSCSRAPNEDNYLFQKMMRAAFGTNNVDNCARVCHSASVHGLAITLGSGAMTNPIKDITQDVDVILLVGSNPTEAHPVIGAQIRQAIQHGTKLIVVDPRKIDLAKDAYLHLPIKPGTNVAFANGMMNIIINEGLADMAFIEQRTEGFEEIRKIVAAYTPERVAEICQIDPDDLREAAVLYAKANKAPIIYCLGVTEHSSGTEGVMSMSNIAMLVGKIGRSGCGVNPLRGQNNVQGACDMGCMPYDFPGYQKVADKKIREKFEQVWNVPLSSRMGLMATQVIPMAGKGEIKGLYIFGEDPVVTDPDTNHVKRALNHLDFLVVQDLFMTETAQYADVVLPGRSYAEKEGTFTNTERRVQRVRKAVEGPGDSRLDTDIFIDMMNAMGYVQSYLTPSDIMKEIAHVTPSFAGISFERLDAGETLQWPCVDQNDPGKYIMHEGQFSRGLGLFYPTEYKPAKELPDKEYPLLMSTGRMLYHYNTGAMTKRTEGLNELAPASYIEINEKDALLLDIKDGDRVSVASRRGHIETTARVSDKTNPQEVFMTFHFQDGNVNELTNAAIDEIARIPEYKVCAVKVEKAK